MTDPDPPWLPLPLLWLVLLVARVMGVLERALWGGRRARP